MCCRRCKERACCGSDDGGTYVLFPFSFWCAVPGMLKVLPATWWLLAHLQITDDQIVVPISWQLPFIHSTAHGDVDQKPEVFHPSRSLRNAAFHNRPTINIPDHPSPPARYTLLLYPRETECMRLCRHVRKGRLDDSVLVVVFAVV